MKVKATLLTFLLGLTSLAACGKSFAAPRDVEDWDTPEEMLAFANYHVTPSVSCSGFFGEKNNGVIEDNKRQICDLLKGQDYKKAKKFEQTDGDHVQYRVKSPYFEYVTVRGASLYIYRNGNVILAVSASTSGYLFYYQIDKDSAEQIFNETTSYIKERIELEKVCEANAQEDLKIENFANILKADVTATYSAYIERLEYRFKSDDNFRDLIASATYAKRSFQAVGRPSLIIVVDKHDDSFGDSRFYYHLDEDYSYVCITDVLSDNFELKHSYAVTYTLDPTVGKNIYDTAMDLVRAQI